MKYCLIFLILILVLCACKTNNTDINTVRIIPTQQAVGQIIQQNIPTPYNLICYVKELNNNLLQAEVIFKNSEMRSYAHRKIAGYNYTWNIYGENIYGFIESEISEEEIVGTSIIFDKKDNDLKIIFKVNADYIDYISKDVSIECN